MLIKMGVCKQFSPLRYRMFISLEKDKFVFQTSLSETPFKPDRVSFCTSKILSLGEANSQNISMSVFGIRSILTTTIVLALWRFVLPPS